MEILALIYGGMGILITTILGLLFFVKDKKFNSVIISFCAGISLFITLVSILSMPSNFILERVISGLIGLLSLIGIFTYFKYKNYSLTPKFLVAISLVGTFVYMLTYMR